MKFDQFLKKKNSPFKMEILSEMKYYHILAEYIASKPLYLDKPTCNKPNIRKCIELPFQQIKAQLWDEVNDTLCNLELIKVKSCIKMKY